MKRFIYLIVFLIFPTAIFAQDLSGHQWQDRLLIIISQSENHQVYKDQIKQLKSDKDGLQERKLVVYHVTPVSFKKGLYEKKWESSTTLFNNLAKSKTDFEILLIGLDGGVKLRQTSLLSTDKLFRTIDAMPMRRAEMEEIKSKK